MAINLKKGSTINLSKIELKKSTTLKRVCVGLNWGAIQGKSFFGLLSSTTNVDLDGSAALFNSKNQLVETVYYNHLFSNNSAIRHSGDDLTGDENGDDGLDNEVITISFDKLPSDISQIVLFLNSFKKQDFSEIPYSKIRIYEGTKDRVDNELAFFNLSQNKNFAGYTSMIMAKLVKSSEGWEFKTIGEPSNTKKIKV